jgi:hypothetical protein
MRQSNGGIVLEGSDVRDVDGGIEEELRARPPAKSTNRLTDRAVRAFIAKSKAGLAPRKKLTDGGGLYLTLTATGTPVWRVKYRIGPPNQLVERVYSVGPVPSCKRRGST